jgi:hypothetical protein
MLALSHQPNVRKQVTKYPLERQFYEMHHILQSKVMDHAVA